MIQVLLSALLCLHIRLSSHFTCRPEIWIVPLLADGVTITAIAATVGMSRRHVYKWARRFLEQGLAGLADKPGRGSRRGE